MKVRSPERETPHTGMKAEGRDSGEAEGGSGGVGVKSHARQ